MKYWNAFGIIMLSIGLIFTNNSISNLATATQNNSKALIIHMKSGCQFTPSHKLETKEGEGC